MSKPKPSYSEQSSLRLTTKGANALKSLLAATLTGGLVWSVVDMVESGSEDPKPSVVCEFPIMANETVYDLAEKAGVDQSEVKVYHPGETTPEDNPVYEIQEGDVAVINLGATACYGAGGMPGDPERPNVIVE